MSNRQDRQTRGQDEDSTAMIQIRMESGELGGDEYGDQSLTTAPRSRNLLKCAAMAIGIATTSLAIIKTPGPSSISDLLIPPAIRAAITTQSSRSLKLQSPDGVEYEIAEDDDCFGYDRKTWTDDQYKKCRKQKWNQENEIYRLDPIKKPDRCKNWKPRRGWNDDWYDICSEWHDAYGPGGYYWTESEEPSVRPSSGPSVSPSLSLLPSAMPSTIAPTSTPSGQPSTSPSMQPTTSEHPTVTASVEPSTFPTASPSNSPTTTTASPSKSPSKDPTNEPTESPSGTPTVKPSANEEDSGDVVVEQPAPTSAPTASPTHSPTETPSASPIKNESSSVVETTAVDLSTFTMNLVYVTARRLVFEKEAEETFLENHRTLIAINHGVLLDAVTSQLSDEFETRYENFDGVILESAPKARVEDLTTNTVTITDEFRGSVLFEGPPSSSIPSKRDLDAAVQDTFEKTEFMGRLEESADPVLAATREVSVKSTAEDIVIDEDDVGGETGNVGNGVNTKAAVKEDGNDDSGGGMGSAVLVGAIACIVSVLLLAGVYVKYRRGRKGGDFIEKKKRQYERKRSPRSLFKNSPTNSDKTDDLSPSSMQSGRKKFFQSLDDDGHQDQSDSDFELSPSGVDNDNFSMPSYMPDDYSLRSDNYSMAASQAASFQQATMAANGLPPPVADDNESDDSSVSNMSALDEVRFSSVLQLDGCLPGNTTDDEASMGGGGDGLVKQMVFNDVWRSEQSLSDSRQVVPTKKNNYAEELSPPSSSSKKITTEEISAAGSSSTEQTMNVSAAAISLAGDLYDEYPLMPEQSFEKYMCDDTDDFCDEVQPYDEDKPPTSHSFTLELLKNSPRLKNQGGQTEPDETDFIPIEGNNMT